MLYSNPPAVTVRRCKSRVDVFLAVGKPRSLSAASFYTTKKAKRARSQLAKGARLNAPAMQSGGTGARGTGENANIFSNQRPHPYPSQSSARRGLAPTPRNAKRKARRRKGHHFCLLTAAPPAVARRTIVVVPPVAPRPTARQRRTFAHRARRAGKPTTEVPGRAFLDPERGAPGPPSGRRGHKRGQRDEDEQGKGCSAHSVECSCGVLECL